MRDQIQKHLTEVNQIIREAAIIQKCPGATRDQEKAIYKVLDNLLDTKNILTKLLQQCSITKKRGIKDDKAPQKADI